MDLRLLEVFCHVYEDRSFSRAAERLLLTQPTISDHIGSLEEQLGTQLFDRLGRKIRPTPAAEVLYAYGKQILDLKKAAIEGMNKFLKKLEGNLRIGGSTIPGEYLLPVLVGEFCKHFPHVDVHIRIADTSDIVSDLLGGRIEIGFVGAEVEDRHLEFRKFQEDTLVVVVPNQGEWLRRVSISTRELAEKPFILREPGSGTRIAFEQCLRENGYSLDQLNVVAEMGSTSAVKEAVKAGIGISVLSTIAVQLEVAAGVLKCIRLQECCHMTRGFYMVSDRRRSRSPLCEAFIDHVLRSSATPIAPRPADEQQGSGRWEVTPEGG